MEYFVNRLFSFFVNKTFQITLCILVPASSVPDSRHHFIRKHSKSQRVQADQQEDITGKARKPFVYWNMMLFHLNQCLQIKSEAWLIMIAGFLMDFTCNPIGFKWAFVWVYHWYLLNMGFKCSLMSITSNTIRFVCEFTGFTRSCLWV